MLASSPNFASGEVDAVVRCLTAERRPRLGGPGSWASLDSEDAGHDHLEGDRLHAGREGERHGRSASVSISRSVTCAIICA